MNHGSFTRRPFWRTLSLSMTALALMAACSKADMEIEPAILVGCATGGGEVIKVSWDATASGTQSVQLGLLRPGKGIKPWGEFKPVGSRSTGPWGSDGLTFILFDEDGGEMARRTIVTSPCPRAQKYE